MLLGYIRHRDGEFLGGLGPIRIRRFDDDGVPRVGLEIQGTGDHDLGALDGKRTCRRVEAVRDGIPLPVTGGKPRQDGADRGVLGHDLIGHLDVKRRRIGEGDGRVGEFEEANIAQHIPSVSTAVRISDRDGPIRIGRDGVVDPFPGKRHGIAAAAARDDIVAAVARDRVVEPVPAQAIRTVAAPDVFDVVQCVLPLTRLLRRRNREIDCQIGAAGIDRGVDSGAAVKVIVARAAIENFVAIAAISEVVAVPEVDDAGRLSAAALILIVAVSEHDGTFHATGVSDEIVAAPSLDRSVPASDGSAIVDRRPARGARGVEHLHAHAVTLDQALIAH